MAIKTCYLGAVSTLPIALLIAAPAMAQQSAASPQDGSTLQDIVVTAQKRSENLQSVPVAVTAVSGSLLRSASIDAGADIPKLTPNLTVNSGSAFFSPYLRGVGTQYANLGLESSVATYFDDLYMSRPQGALTSFNDIARVEVLKGPQGSLFGRNAAGGALRIITNDPVYQFEGNVGLTTGSFNRLGVDGVLNVPLSDKLAVRFAYFHDERDGYVHNINPALPRMNDRNIDMIRGKLLFQPTDRLTIKISGDYSDKNDFEGASFINVDGAPRQTGVAIGGTPSPDFYTATQDRVKRLHIKQAGVQVRVDYEFDPFTLSSISGWRYNNLRAPADLDTVDIPFQHDVFLEKSDSYSQEIQAVSNGTGPFKWTAGLYYFREVGGNTFQVFGQAVDGQFGVPSGPLTGEVNTGPQLNAISHLTTDSFAPYMQASYGITDSLEILVGLRYTWEKKTLDSNEVFATGLGPDPLPLSNEAGASRKFKKFTPKIGISYKPVDRVLLYASYSQGFKSGGFNTPAFTIADTVEPETLDDFEIGWKTQFNNVRFNGSAFYYKYKDLQVQRTDQNTGGTAVENAASAKIWGIETDITWAPSRQVELGVGGGYLHTRYKNYLGDAYVACDAFPTNAQCITQGGLGYGIQAGVDFSGQGLPQAPKISGYVRGQFEQPLSDALGTLRLNALLSYTDEFYYNPERSLREPARTLLNAGLTWVLPGDKYSISVFGDNILDRKYSILKVRQGTGGWRIPGPPATWGVRFQANF
ncbi:MULTISPECIES: TonB-dependent receptor [Sphingobium]|uniref:TonB-dependent receptor n=1 Tax=Sphingobium sp. MI1205 TaxID=407020 RepID=UPI0007705E06|nr:TonB-dependent receptor [Sphingobium sp. MI1205]AMK19919.1 TonB-dependent receptor [Sphingobium sp. MI1205]